jgi:hypothetical protein
MAHRILLGPQRPNINLGEAVAAAPFPDGPLAVISAGWQEAEGDIDDLRALVDRPLIDLELYHRAERVFANDQALTAIYRERQDRLQELQRLYRLRLAQAMLAARRIRRAVAAQDLIAAEERHAIAQLRALDRHHFRRVQSVFDEFAASIAESGALAEHTAAIEAQLKDCAAVMITGGHVLVLLNRLQLFGLRRLLSNRHLITWSAGAMVLSDQLVLFHDKTPLGRRDPELVGPGLGLLPGYIVLPDAQKRLRTKDPVRTGLFSSRFAPARCITLNNGSQLHLEGGKVVEALRVGQLRPNGVIASLNAA